MPRLVETEQEFLIRHGNRPLKVSSQEWVLADGAVVHNDGYGASLYEPPDDRRACLERQRQYAAGKAQRAERDFHKLQGALTGAVDEFGVPIGHHWDAEEYGPGPPDGLDALRLLQSCVLERRAVLEKIDAQIESLPEVQAECARAAQLQQEQDAARSRAEHVKHEAQSITI
jgi:hypothetical protein